MWKHFCCHDLATKINMKANIVACITCVQNNEYFGHGIVLIEVATDTVMQKKKVVEIPYHSEAKFLWLQKRLFIAIQRRGGTTYF